MQISLDSMSTKEKLKLMEMLWKDLSKTEEKISSPTWHKQVLQQRGENLNEGKEKIIDWEDAKKDIRTSL